MRVSGEAIDFANCIDKDRLWSFLMRLAEYGEIEGGGVDRQALTETDTAAKNIVCDWAASEEFAVFQDEAANLFVRFEGRDHEAEPVLIGSHLDTQPTGGKFDGAYGVVAGYEVLMALKDFGKTPKRPIEIAAWTNEEGSRFLPGATGSSAFAGVRDLETMTRGQTTDGKSVADELQNSIAQTRAKMRPMAAQGAAAHLEAHIEQGPILEEGNLQIGVVTGIQGVRRIKVEIAGETAHAGTTPHAMRKDALEAAVRIMAALHPLTQKPDDILRLTFGKIDVHPNSPSTVSDRAELIIDLRHPDMEHINAVTDQIRVATKKHSAPCDASVDVLSDVAPVRFPEKMISLFSDAATRSELPFRKITSGAGHDSLHLAKMCPTGMVFVPCEGGVSHNVSENATAEDLAAGARVIAAAAWTLANA